MALVKIVAGAPTMGDTLVFGYSDGGEEIDREHGFVTERGSVIAVSCARSPEKRAFHRISRTEALALAAYLIKAAQVLDKREGDL